MLRHISKIQISKIGLITLPVIYIYLLKEHKDKMKKFCPAVIFKKFKK